MRVEFSLVLGSVLLPCTCAESPEPVASQSIASEPAVRRPLEREAPSPHGHRRNVAVLVFEGVELLDFAGPVETFTDTRGWDEPLRVYTVGASRRPVRTLNAVTVVADYSAADAPDPDILVIPGGEVRCLGGDTPLGNYIREQVPKVEIVFSVCNGIFALTDDHWLDGLAATTHSSSIGWLRTAAPKTEVRASCRFVDNGHIVTAAGISAGIDGALHLVERLLGPECARRTAGRMEYEWRGAPTEPDAAADPIERGRRAWYRGDWKEGREVYGQLAEERPDDVVVLTRLGTCLLFSTRGEEGLEVLERAARLGSSDALLYDALGYARSNVGRIEEALAAYTMALELDPARIETRRGLGTTQAALGRHREAAENLQAVWDRGQGDDGMLAQIARSWAACGEREPCIAALHEIDPEDLADVLADPVFDGLREDPRVVEIAERTERANAQDR